MEYRPSQNPEEDNFGQYLVSSMRKTYLTFFGILTVGVGVLCYVSCKQDKYSQTTPQQVQNDSISSSPKDSVSQLELVIKDESSLDKCKKSRPYE